MKKLKIILQSNFIYYSLLSFTFLYIFLFITLIKPQSIYSGTENLICGKIINKNIDGDKLTLIVKDREKVIINYYFKTKKAKQKFKLTYGDYIKCYGKLIKPKDNTNFNVFNYKKYLYSKNIFYIFKAEKIKLEKNNKNILYSLKQKIENRINRCSKTKEYINAFVIGNKKEIDVNLYNKYQNLGISHLFAISGMHITLITCILLFLLKKIKYKNVIINVFLIFYLFITNFSPSVLRSVLIFILYEVVKKLKLKIKTINILIFLFSILLLINPFYIYDLGFKFSFFICFSLLYFKNNIDDKHHYISKTFYISSISFFISLPLVVNNFYQINLLSIIFNLFYVPFISIIIFPLGIVTFIFPLFDNIYYLFIIILENITNFFTKLNTVVFVAKLPIILIIIYYIIVINYFKKPKKAKKIYLLVILLVFYNYNRVVIPEITFIDVGQGDSSLLRIYDKNILIDTGGKLYLEKEKWAKNNTNNTICNNILLPTLKSLGVKKIDYLILSHGDNDHLGEAKELKKKFNINNIIINKYEINAKEKEIIKNEKYKQYKNGDYIEIYDIILYFLNPEKDNDNENLNSLIVYTKINNYNILLMGDAGIENEKFILDEYDLRNMDIIKLGHHGSNTSSSYRFLKETKVKYAVISVGENNRYNHPSKEVIKRLNKLKIKKYRTDRFGSIKFKLGKKIKITTATQ